MISEHIATATTHIRRTPYQALSAVLVMTLTFFAASVIAFLAYAAGTTLHYLETRPQIIAFLKSEATPEEISALQRQLMEDQKIVGGVRYVSREDAFHIFQGMVVDNPLITELVPPDILPASLEFSVSDLTHVKGVIDNLKHEAIVDSVEFTGSLGGEGEIAQAVGRLEQITRYIRVGGTVVLGFLAFTATLILVVIIGMRIAMRREEIEILRLIGATVGFIRAPFVFEGILYGILGTLVGFLVSLLLFLYAMPQLATYFGEIPVIPKDPMELVELAGILLAAELALAGIIGLLGSWIAISRYLRL